MVMKYSQNPVEKILQEKRSDMLLQVLNRLVCKKQLAWAMYPQKIQRSIQKYLSGGKHLHHHQRYRRTKPSWE